ncbi:23S rRNA (guanine745-N1)-methyltransferase [Enterococcus sp. PF1-24]|uniref:methyltransferase domain-containing protein n=1 Tax=unclassified Enterococcus TaxID=2608891 RepID=UPI0024762FD7|nr:MULTISPECIES: methyltransferase domain-containing protein [unclassified Enterococcus]MDH6365777.1 23S rRNA (guanine745-N1)-methyltransferase [Enterococcus sp. PFB1-1]MDH6402873.1 23S rRNA (guanine745-N1)-methyltransferase [Enterococcus sp. PF1-24]
MTLKKIEQGRLFLAENPALFRCPFCHSDVKQQAYSLSCENNHRFDLSKKGTLFFLKQNHQSGYDEEMFLPRGRLIRGGMYQPVLTVIRQWLGAQEKVLDIGCGEGSFLAELENIAKIPLTVGFDIAKEGVYLATNHNNLAQQHFWCVADLTNLPFADNSFQRILNIFSPSHYQEFQRVLADEGELIKVIPGKEYLKELRQAFYPEEKAKQHYSNEKVLEKLAEKMTIVEEQQLTYSFAIPETLRLDLLEMSPLEWGVSQERKAFLREHPLKEITIDVHLLRAKKK